MRRHRVHLTALTAAALVVVAGALGPAGLAAAQTTTTTTTTTAPVTPTTVPVTTAPITVPPIVITTTAGGTPATTILPTVSTQANADDKDDSGSSIPWIPIIGGIALLVILIVAIALLSRRRGARRQLVVDWRRRAADATAEAGATARLLSQGTPPSGQIAQQLLASLRAFEDLEQSAPDDATADTAERARRALQTLGLAIDSDYRVRRTPGADPQQLVRSQEAVQNAAGETDRTLRGVYRSFTAND